LIPLLDHCGLENLDGLCVVVFEDGVEDDEVAVELDGEVQDPVQ